MNKRTFDCEQLEHLQHLERLQTLSRLQRLNAVGEIASSQKLETSAKDYREYEHRDGDVVYCDIPYKGAENDYGGFDWTAFFDWADSRDFPVYFSSYENPDTSRFAEIWSKETVTLINKDRPIKRTERLFVQRRFYNG